MWGGAFGCIFHRRVREGATRPGAKLPRQRRSAGICSQICSDDGKTAALQKEQHHAANRDGQRQTEEQTAIVHYDDAEDREMTEDRTGHNGECEAGAEPCGRRKQNQNCRDQFGNTGTKATPRFESDFAKDIDGFRRAREFEKQCLQENDRRRDATNPGDDCRYFAGVIHKGFSFPVLSKEKPIPYSDSTRKLNCCADLAARPLVAERYGEWQSHDCKERDCPTTNHQYEANPFPCAYLAVAARPSRESAITGEESSDS